jgi:hypothetical protein
MAIQQDLVAYHKSISSELKSTKSRIRQLIGSAHWQTDGEHKESILRKVIEDFAPESLRIGKGFVCYPNSELSDAKSSKQIDILITSKSKPTLYKDIDLHLVTADAVEAIVEVKTKLQVGESLESALASLSNNTRRIRENSRNQNSCWAGLFVYESGSVSHQSILEALQKIVNHDEKSAINCVAVGADLFVRFWLDGHPTSSPTREPMWHSYQLKDLAHSYFISNLIMHLSPNSPEETSSAWFPIPNSKESYKHSYAKLADDAIHPF